MLFIFHGSDIKASDRAFRQWRQKLSAKRPAASVFWLESTDLTADRLAELLASRALFADYYLVAARRLLAESPAKDLLLDNRQALKDSGHVFLLWEENLPAGIGPLKQAAEQVKEYKLKTKNPDRPIFNIFSLNDALGQRDRKKLWLLLMEAQMIGLSAEEIYWRLFDQVKKLILIKTAVDPAALTKPPFSYKSFYIGKLKTQAANFQLAELRQLADQLMTAYRYNRLGRRELSISLEQLAMAL